MLNKIPMNEETLGNAKNLKLICITATGTNIVDFPYTNGRGITVTNVKGYSTPTVVQHTFALYFYLAEHISYYDNCVKSRFYSKSEMFVHHGPEFHDPEMGLVQPHPLLEKEGGTGIVYFDCQGDEKIQRGKYHNSAEGQKNIQSTFSEFTVQVSSLFLPVFYTNTHHSIPQKRPDSKKKFDPPRKHPVGLSMMCYTLGKE